MLYTSSRAEEAFLDALRKPALPEAPEQQFEVCIIPCLMSTDVSAICRS